MNARITPTASAPNPAIKFRASHPFPAAANWRAVRIHVSTMHNSTARTPISFIPNPRENTGVIV
jgi:hypothetical protein